MPVYAKGSRKGGVVQSGPHPGIPVAAAVPPVVTVVEVRQPEESMIQVNFQQHVELTGVESSVHAGGQCGSAVQHTPQQNVESNVHAGGQGVLVVQETLQQNVELAYGQAVTNVDIDCAEKVQGQAVTNVEIECVETAAPQRRGRKPKAKKVDVPIQPSPTKEALRSAGPASCPEGLPMKVRRVVKTKNPYTPPQGQKKSKQQKRLEECEESPDPERVSKKLTLNEISRQQR